MITEVATVQNSDRHNYIRFQLYEILIKFFIDYMYNHNTVLIRRGLCSFFYISLAPTGEGEVTHIIQMYH